MYQLSISHIVTSYHHIILNLFEYRWIRIFPKILIVILKISQSTQKRDPLTLNLTPSIHPNLYPSHPLKINLMIGSLQLTLEFRISQFLLKISFQKTITKIISVEDNFSISKMDHLSSTLTILNFSASRKVSMNIPK